MAHEHVTHTKVSLSATVTEEHN